MKKTDKLPKVEPVKIKPLFGIKPNIWVSACYLVGTILIIFLIGFLPDLLHGSKQVSFSSKAGTSAVYVDSIYVGGTPTTTTIPSGDHVVEFKIEDEIIDTQNIKVGHPVFFNWLFQRKMKVSSNNGINLTTYKKLTKTFLEDVANYSAILNYDQVFRYPPLFVNYATAISSLDSLSSTDYKDVLNCALAFVTTNEMLEDAKSAYSMLNISFNFSEIENAVVNKDFKNETEHLIGLSMKSSSTLESEYFKRSGVSINGFTFDDYTVSESMFYYFVKENPKWAAANKENLISEGLVDSNYLEGVTLSSLNTSRPVRNVSYYAATAFCDWLSKKTGKDVFIPEELQWVTAARFSSSEFQKTLIPNTAKSGPSGVLGSVWEMTSTPYVPLLKLFDYSVYDVLEKYNVQAEVIIKGGSYVSKSDSVTVDTIGFAPLSLCSDYMGFRLAWR